MTQKQNDNKNVSNGFSQEALKQAVAFYQSLGLTVIPLKFGEKTPALESWKIYQTRKPTEEELDQWFSGEPRNIGVVCGRVSKNLGVIDFDKAEIYYKFFDTKKIEAETLVVKTARSIHVYLFSDRPFETFKIPDLSIDVKGEGGYVVAPPSIHPSGAQYTIISQARKITQVIDLEESIWKKAEQLGAKRPTFNLDEPDHLPCIRIILQGVREGSRGPAGMRLLAYYLYFNHEDRNVAVQKLRAWNRRNKPPLPEDRVQKIIKDVIRGGYEYGCNGMREIQTCNEDIMKTCRIANALKIRKLNIIKTPFVELNDGRLAEEGYDGEKVYYIVYDPKDGSVKKEDFLVEGEVRFEPILDKDIETFQVLLPSEAAEYGSDEELWKEVEAFLDYWHEELDRQARKLDCGYVFKTHLTFGKNGLGIIPRIGGRRFLGSLGRGKTAEMQVVGAICYRPFYLAGCSTDAAVRRLFDIWRGTALVDEADFSRSDLYATIIKILNIGIDAQLGWYRCCDENDPKKILSFYVFGPKILTTRRRFADAALESKFLTTISRENKSPKPLFRWKKFNAQALQLRNKLLLWRFKHYYEFKQKVDQLEDPDVTKKIFGEELDVSSRVKEIILPIALLTNGKTLKILKEAAVQHDKILKQLDLEADFENQVSEALRDLIKDEAHIHGDHMAHVAHLLLERGASFLSFNFADIVDQLLSKEAGDEERKSIVTRLGRFFQNNGIQVERIRIPKTGRIRVAFIPKDNPLLIGATIEVVQEGQVVQSPTTPPEHLEPEPTGLLKYPSKAEKKPEKEAEKQ